MSTKLQLLALRADCEASLYDFARVMEPHRVFGAVHEELFNWWQFDAGENSLCLIPRDHQKSHCMAVLTAWLITKNPAITIIYLSATSNLAQKQLRAIKNILLSDQYQALWPEMINTEESKREVWNNDEICVDHPLRKAEGVRDSTVMAVGLTTNSTGLHCEVLMKDDLVVPDNAYTVRGREAVSDGASQFASILTTGGEEYCVGTRYHGRDHYQDLIDMEEEEITDEGDVVGKHLVYNIFEKKVEINGKFLWPRQSRPYDGKEFGFNFKELARKKAKYKNRIHFFSQYYNNPNDIETQDLTRDNFQYYDASHLNMKHGVWHFKNRRLNVYAAMDFASSLADEADSTCIVVIGYDWQQNVYILDIERFKTDKVDNFFKAVLRTHSKWGYSWIRPEVNMNQAVFAKYIKDKAKENGLSLKVDPIRHSGSMGSKEERMYATLQPLYEGMKVYHRKGGNFEILEEELLDAKPAHDDVKDTLAIVCSWDKLVAPRRPRQDEDDNVHYLQPNKRFGGVA